MWSGAGPERHGIVRKSLPRDTSVYNVLPGQRPLESTTVTSMKADGSGHLPPPQMRQPSMFNPWARIEGVQVQAGAEQARLQQQGSTRPGAPPRKSEEDRDRIQRSIADRRATAAKQTGDRPARPVENEVPEAWNLERRWSWG